MFNIVKHRDFMLARDLSTKEEAEKLREGYGTEYVVVETAEPTPTPYFGLDYFMRHEAM